MKPLIKKIYLLLGLTCSTFYGELGAVNITPGPICKKILSEIGREFPNYSIERKENEYKFQLPQEISPGNIKYSLYGDKLNIEFVYTHSPYRKKGISLALHAQLFLDHPEVRCVSLCLSMDNSGAYKKAFENTHSHPLAAKATPAFKTLTKFGFELNPRRSIFLTSSPQLFFDNYSLFLKMN